jgi:predicted small integral membrane protein
MPKNNKKKRLGLILSVVALAAFGVLAQITGPQMVFAEDSKCTSILDSGWCDGQNGEGILNLVKMVKNIFSIGVGVAATIGIIICGVTIMTARDNEAQVAKAKQRIFDIVIGLVIWVMLYFVLDLLLPDMSDTEVTKTSYTSISTQVS